MWEQKVGVSADWNADFQLNLSQSSSEKPNSASSEAQRTQTK